MERHRLELRYNEALACEVIAVVRDHHETMPGPERDRPGFDRVCVRTLDGREAVLDVWSRAGQSIRAAERQIELVDAGDFLTWRAAPAQPARPASSADVRARAVLPVEDSAGPAGVTPHAPPRAAEGAPSSSAPLAGATSGDEHPPRR
jgi:hypothetical protein